MGKNGISAFMKQIAMMFAMLAFADAFVSPPVLAVRGVTSQLAASKVAPPTMSLELSSLDQISTAVAGVVAVDGGTIGLDVSFAAFLAVILGLFIPVVFLVTVYIQSEAQGTATSFRQPDFLDPSDGSKFKVGVRYDEE